MREKKNKKYLKTFLLLAMALSMIMGAVVFSWYDSIDQNLNRDKEKIDVIKKELSLLKDNEPLNIVFLGSDKRYEDKGDTGRSDTLMIMRIDFKKERVYLISIPRDSRVRIPGRGFDKINAAYAYGGPRLSIRTVESFTGLSIHHYVEVDFNGFKKIVDALGGIEVDVKETINDRSREFSVGIPKGKHLMDGNMALTYARYRHGDSDFKRAERQQNFLKAVVGNALNFKSIWKLPRLINILSNNTITDLTMGEMRDLGIFLRTINEDHVESITIPGKSGMRNGVSYVFPDEDGLDRVIETIDEGRSLKELKSALESGKMSSNNNISVDLLNGSGVNGMAIAAKNKLSARGFKIVGVNMASRSDYSRTQIIVNALNRSKALIIKKALLNTAEVKIVNEKLRSDVKVIIGKDYVSLVRSDE